MFEVSMYYLAINILQTLENMYNKTRTKGTATRRIRMAKIFQTIEKYIFIICLSIISFIFIIVIIEIEFFILAFVIRVLFQRFIYIGYEPQTLEQAVKSL
jgi:hypothetical protein